MTTVIPHLEGFFPALVKSLQALEDLGIVQLKLDACMGSLVMGQHPGSFRHRWLPDMRTHMLLLLLLQGIPFL